MLLVIIAIGGPVGIVVRKLYGKKGTDDSKFANSGTYVRDDSLYSYNSTNEDQDEYYKQNNNS